MGKKIDLTGQKFGRLTVLQEYPKRNNSGGVQWVCQCECGNQIIVNSDNLRRNHTKSCGCQKKISAQKRFIDLTGQKFGKLTVIGKSPRIDPHRDTYWLCDCDCGRKGYEVLGNALKRGITISCGCGSQSQGELEIINLLQENNIKFEEQKTFETCRFPKTNRKGKFDFYLPDYNILIEFDGTQHFYNNEYSLMSKEEFINQLERDKFKNEWCKNNNIPLVRIPYYFLHQIKIEDLLPGSKFII